MRTANNTDNNFSVENLVEKYCTHVNPSRDDNSSWTISFNPSRDDNPSWTVIDSTIGAGVYGQLLVTLYSSVAGNDADKQVLSTLSEYAEKYQKDALEEEEFVFLCEHFKEVVAYVFSVDDHRHILVRKVPCNTIKIIQEMAKPKEGQTIFLTDARYGDIAASFPGCIVKGFTGFAGIVSQYTKDNLEIWAWGQIRLYALGIKSEIVPDVPETIWPDESKTDNEVTHDFTYTLPEKGSIDIVIIDGESVLLNFMDIRQLYELLKDGGTMFWVSDKKKMAGNGKGNSFRKQLVLEKSINTLVSFYEDFSWFIREEVVLTYIIKKRAHKRVRVVNDKEEVKSAMIKAEDLDSDILWPSYYLATRPSTGRLLSSIVKSSERVLVKLKKTSEDNSTNIESVYSRIESVTSVTPTDLGASYKDAYLMAKEIDSVAGPEDFCWIPFQLNIAKQPCIFISGNAEGLRIGYTTQVAKNGYTYNRQRCCALFPKKGIDSRYVAALLFLPSVAEQIITICEGEIGDEVLSLVLDKIIIPDHDEKERLAFLSEANYEALIASKQEMEKSFEEKFAAQKTEYINEVRMRKHDMGQYIFELGNIEDLIRFYIENRETEKDFCKHIETLLDEFRVSLGELSTMLDNLSKEEQFGTPKAFSIDTYLSQLEKRYKHDGFKITYNPDLSSFMKYNASRIGIENNSYDERKAMIPPSLYVALNDIQRAVHNIIDNARKHGFTDPQRTDYEIRVGLSIDMERNMFNIEFRNNGNPLPKGMDKIRYGIKGEKAGKNAGTGLGGNYIKQFVEHYRGDYDIFMEDEWTVVRICLPIK